MWLIFGTVAYIKESGDFSILDEPVPFDNKEGSEVSLFEHLRVSFNTSSRTSAPTMFAPHRPCRLERLPEPELLLLGSE